MAVITTAFAVSLFDWHPNLLQLFLQLRFALFNLKFEWTAHQSLTVLLNPPNVLCDFISIWYKFRKKWISVAKVVETGSGYSTKVRDVSKVLLSDFPNNALTDTQLYISTQYHL